MNTIKILEDKEILEKLQAQENPYFQGYFAYYSSWYGGITKNPRLMLLPIDDHIVHRGDGIFEAMKAVGGSIYLLNEHLHRLFLSAEKIGLTIPYSFEEIKQLILQTLQVSGKEDVVIRLYVSRGPGNFGVNPYESIKPQLYIVITQLTEPSPEKIKNGARVGLSSVPVKPPLFAQTKSCNYLVNVLMKKEAVDQGLDFVIGVDSNGFITESATENILMVDKNGVIVHPLLENILRGTTMIRACELARQKGLQVKEQSISVAELKQAQEVFIAGTTQNVLPVVEFAGQLVADGKPGKITRQLQNLITEDILRKKFY